MTITIPPALAKRFEELAKERGTTPEQEDMQSIHASLPKQEFIRPETHAWLAKLTDCGVSLTDEQLSREVMYES